MIYPATPLPGEIFTGRAYINLLDPDPASFNLVEIFTALSRLPRFTGHGRRVITVGEHVLLCLQLAKRAAEPLPVMRAVLMHDAAEAYLGDVAAPLKAHLPDYRRIERKMEAAIFGRYRIPNIYKMKVREIDLMALTIEKKAIMPDAGRWDGDRDITGLEGLVRSTRKSRTPNPDKICAALLQEAWDLGVVQ